MDYDRIDSQSKEDRPLLFDRHNNDLGGLMGYIAKNLNFRFAALILLLSIVVYSDVFTEAVLPSSTMHEGLPTTYGYFLLHLFIALAVLILDLAFREGL